MPCWEVNLMTVSFKVKNKERLVRAASNVGMSVTENGSELHFRSGYVNFTVDLEKETVRCKTSRRAVDLLNSVKREYSSLTLQKVAKKKRFAVRTRGLGQYQLVR